MAVPVVSILAVALRDDRPLGRGPAPSACSASAAHRFARPPGERAAVLHHAPTPVRAVGAVWLGASVATRLGELSRRGGAAGA